ncbi:beta-N-acetylhexosaminidase [Hymenobacter terrestris]|uniref:Family 20 glycosylhydrolase n=1 Tax=Hymenobacter terrestris TaxID=2748310 RepID=A0ABX2Q871_9BACT|nr:family 20 glycosylhydrolase [Hymenobacter terrestris]NVO86784.1 family 20 glycosylhydrolase [Hymenobacter terrestris]
MLSLPALSRRFLALLPALLLLASSVVLAQPAAPTDTRNLLPVPTSVRWGTTTLKPKTTLRPLFQGNPDSITSAAVTRTLNRLGLNAPVKNQSANTLPLQISYGKIGRPELFDEERYSLRVTPSGVTIDAPTSLGVLRALATLEQLPQVVGRNVVLPEVDIQDQPRFAWRGLLIDAARHFMPVSVIKRNLDAMAATKLNVLHWHLSDDQGFRVESKTLPRLHQVSGQYYTHAQVREVLRYAAARGIRVLPEFDVPGHTIAWQSAYPQLASGDTLYKTVYQSWRLANVAMDPTKETTYELLDTLFGEMTALFPDPYFHIGGDENDGRQWRGNPRIMAFAKAKKMLKSDGKTLDKHALQTYFNRRVLTMLTKYNKQMVGWDEILGPGLPKNAVIQSWRGKKGLYDAAKAGNRAILSNGYYLDLYLSASNAYGTDPLPVDNPLSVTQQRLIMGGEATMWSEFADSVIIDSRIWPRAAAVAERLWSAREVTSTPDMYRRLAVVSRQLEGLGLQHRSAPEQLLRQLAGPTDVVPLRTLTQVLEPVKEYKRHFQGFTYTPSTPLNRLVDAAPAESDVARNFNCRVDSLMEAMSTAQARGSVFAMSASRRNAVTMRQQLQTWQANHSLLIPLLASSPTLTEYAPLSAALSAAAALGLERLALLEKQQQPDAEWQAEAIKQLDALNKPAGQTELVLLPAIRRLVELK